MDIAEMFEVADELGDRLLRHAGSFGEIRGPDAFQGHVGHHVVVDDSVVVEACLDETLLETVGELPRGEDEQQQQRRVLVRIGHATIVVRKLD